MTAAAATATMITAIAPMMYISVAGPCCGGGGSDGDTVGVGVIVGEDAVGVGAEVGIIDGAGASETTRLVTAWEP